MSTQELLWPGLHIKSCVPHKFKDDTQGGRGREREERGKREGEADKRSERGSQERRWKKNTNL